MATTTGAKMDGQREKPMALASRFREVLLNGTWIANTNFRDQLSRIDWKQATTRIRSLNTIADLTFHIHYYIKGVVDVLMGKPLAIKDQHSFDTPSIETSEAWEEMKRNLWTDAERFASLVEQLPENTLERVFVEEKYGTYRRNIEGMIEHCYYHLGQVVLIRKLL